MITVLVVVASGRTAVTGGSSWSSRISVGGKCLAERGGQDLIGGLELLPPGLEVGSLLPGDVCG